MSKARSRSSRPPRSRSRRKPGAVVSAVRPSADQIAVGHGVVLWDVEFVREAGQELLRVAFDREGGIDADTLTRLSEDLSRELDATGAVPGEERYVLEVSSPGAERRLRTPEQFRVCRGRFARLTFKDGRQPMEGTIGAVDDDGVDIERDGEVPVRVSYDEISQARLSVPGV